MDSMAELKASADRMAEMIKIIANHSVLVIPITKPKMTAMKPIPISILIFLSNLMTLIIPERAKRMDLIKG